MSAEKGTTPPLPVDVTHFAFPKSLTWLVSEVFVGFIAFAAFGAALPWIEPGRSSTTIALMAIAVFGALALFTWRSLRRLWDGVAVNEDGIWYLPRQGAATFIAWCDIASVTARDVSQRLVLTDTSGRRTIQLEYQLQDFGKLRDYVVIHASFSTRLGASYGSIFHRTMINKVILLSGIALTVALALTSFVQGQPVSALFFVTFSGFGLVLVMRDPSQLEITRDSVVIKYPLWQREVPFRDMESVQLTDLADRGNRWAVVTVNRKIGKPIRLFRFREGSLALNGALQAALKKSAAKG